MREFIKAVSNSLRGIFQHELIALSIYEPELERFRLIRQVFEASDFPPEIFAPEDAARELALRDEA